MLGAQQAPVPAAFPLALVSLQVVVADIDADSAAAVAHQLGVHATPFKCDVKSVNDIKAMVKHAVQEYGRLDVLVNNAAWWVLRGCCHVLLLPLTTYPTALIACALCKPLHASRIVLPTDNSCAKTHIMTCACMCHAWTCHWHACQRLSCPLTSPETVNCTCQGAPCLVDWSCLTC